MISTRRSIRSSALACVISLAAGCAGQHQAAVEAPTVSANTPALTQSLFARDPSGHLTEEQIQTILASPLELDLPARVGVLPVVEAEDWRGPGPDYEIPGGAVSRLAKNLPSERAFSLVTEMLPIPSGALGMEALREIAARYKLRYIVLYRENVRRRIRANPWAAGYVTLLGMLFLPGSTLRVDGSVEASLFDVKTGLLLFTVRRRVAAARGSNLWYRADKLDELQAALAGEVATKLAGDVRRALFAYAEATRLENQRIAARAGGERRASAPPRELSPPQAP
jgi:hypothetical protein